MVRVASVAEAKATSMLDSRARRYPGRYLGAGLQRRGIAASQKPLRSDAILLSVQRSRRSFHHQVESASRDAGKNLVSVAVPREVVLSQRCDVNVIKGTASADEVEAVDVQHCQIQFYNQDPIVDAEPLLLPEMAVDDVESACTPAQGRTEVIRGAEVPCVPDPIGHVLGSPAACISETSSLQANLSEVLIEEHSSLTKERLEMVQVDLSTQPPDSARQFGSSSCSSLRSSPLPTPRKPNWEEARGRSKFEIKAVLSLHVVTDQLRARHGKVDKSEGADTWANFVAAGA